MEKLLLAGMNVARLNFSHGEFSEHKVMIENLRCGRYVSFCPHECLELGGMKASN
jgi:hypothetical protein